MYLSAEPSASLLSFTCFNTKTWETPSLCFLLIACDVSRIPICLADDEDKISEATFLNGNNLRQLISVNDSPRIYFRICKHCYFFSKLHEGVREKEKLTAISAI